MREYYNGFVFTINNPTVNDARLLHNPPDFVQFLIFQLELSETETEHFQGYVQTNVKMTRNSIIEKLLPRGHVEFERSSPETNIHYCSKPVENCLCEHCTKTTEKVGGPWKYGEVCLERVDGASRCMALVSTGERCKAISAEDYCKQHDGFKLDNFIEQVHLCKKLGKQGYAYKTIAKKTGLSVKVVRGITKIPVSKFVYEK